MSKSCEKCGGKDFTDGGKCRTCKRASNQKYLAKLAGGG